MSRADQLAFRWLIAAGILLVAGVLAFAYVAIASAFDSSIPHNRAFEVGLQDAAGNSLLFVIPGVLVGVVGVRLIRQPPSGWRRLFLIAAVLYLLWSLIFIGAGIGVLFIPSAVCALISALLANGI